MKRKSYESTLTLVQGALIAALYVAVNYTQELVLPSTTTGPVQFRISEILCTLVLFYPAAIPGVTIGCLLSNLVALGVLPLDMVLGTTATLLAAICAYRLRNIKMFKIPMLSLFMPVIFNSVIIGLELEIFYVKSEVFFTGFLLQAGLVALGEFVVCVLGGIPFYLLLSKTEIKKNK
ncbi:MAG: QueT transporter family protein [Ruminococcaceae bacterium]|nr:QueT transporter family protein [Oscillospiraceae bacterium]